MENDTDRDKLDGRNQYGLEDLPPAPYLQYLGRYDETGLSGDLSQARDMGRRLRCAGRDIGSCFHYQGAASDSFGGRTGKGDSE